VDPVELNPKRSTAWQRVRCGKATRLGGAEILEQSDGSTGVCTDFVHACLLPVELLDDDEGQYNIMLIEAEKGVRVCEQHTGVENV
jgi:hypothetical protein